VGTRPDELANALRAAELIVDDVRAACTADQT
jgi:hypothetical protein